MPADFGFGFRSAQDTIWGLFPAANYSYTEKIWSDTQQLQTKYDDRFNIIYDYPEITAPSLGNYTSVSYWNSNINLG